MLTHAHNVLLGHYMGAVALLWISMNNYANKRNERRRKQNAKRDKVQGMG